MDYIFLIILGALVLLIFFVQWLYYQILSWRESRRMWREFEAKMKHEREQRLENFKKACDAFFQSPQGILYINAMKKRFEDKKD